MVIRKDKRKEGLIWVPPNQSYSSDILGFWKSLKWKNIFATTETLSLSISYVQRMPRKNTDIQQPQNALEILMWSCKWVSYFKMLPLLSLGPITILGFDQRSLQFKRANWCQNPPKEETNKKTNPKPQIKYPQVLYVIRI